MPISTVNRVRTITLPLTSASGSGILPIYQNTDLIVGQDLIPDHTIISFNCFVKNLKAFAKIDSLPEIALPDFELDDSETTKLYKTLEIEWGSARKQLSLYVATGNDAWSPVGSVSLLNPSGYPFRIYNLMDMFTDNLALELGENSKIGVGIDEVGNGLLQGADKVTIHGSYVEEIFVKYTEVQPLIQVTAQVPIQLEVPFSLPVTVINQIGANSPGVFEPSDPIDSGFGNTNNVDNITAIGN